MDPMLRQALRTAYGPLADFARKAAKNPELWDTAFRKFLRGKNPWVRDALSQEGVFQFKDSVLVEGQNPFVAGDHFKVDVSATAPVKINRLGEEFAAHFLPAIEENVKPVTLVRHVVRDHYIPRVFCELREGCAVNLAHLWEALRRQRNHETDGILPVDSQGSFMFMYDKDRRLWVVHVYWYYDGTTTAVHNGWVIDALPFGDRTFLNTDYYPQVLSSVA